ncbi:hypothetical protein TSOC_000864 [Tetrabaena socialis]|uniref:Uncharacterized protein n=1 Tax=Tetrabaena socialis TaxID=47790 RepID=A0A2J8AIB4_9CHLO|nr:hypothetical protein TSOC_000864 [Tetrabaena socialis]|eukprot:PNH12263.1 hypothetical protein TSOC_000864 [Tetrabaena socialis]
MASHRLSYALIAPFITWGVIIVVINFIGYNSLRGMSAPIATLNVVNEVLVRFHRVIYYTLEVAGALSVTATAYFKAILANELSQWRTDVAVMLYGKNVLGSGTESASVDLLYLFQHYRLATTGVLFGGTSRPADLLYHTDACLCGDPEACQPDGSPYFQATRNGLDVLLNAHFSAAESLITQPDEASGLNTIEFHLLWATGQQDMEGGLSMMNEVFLGDVQDAYNKVEVQQVAMFVISWLLALAFLVFQLRPFLRKALGETRRIAELLSQLPAEVNVEGLVMRVIIGDGQRKTSSTGAKPSRPSEDSAHVKRRGGMQSMKQLA